MPNENEAKWYVVHTYSGYENKVAQNIEKIVEHRGLENLILAVNVPVEKVVETTEKGEKIRKCENCDATETEEIAKKKIQEIQENNPTAEELVGE